MGLGVENGHEKAQRCTRRNPKSECRNSKQIPTGKMEMGKSEWPQKSAKSTKRAVARNTRKERADELWQAKLKLINRIYALQFACLNSSATFSYYCSRRFSICSLLS